MDVDPMHAMHRETKLADTGVLWILSKIYLKGSSFRTSIQVKFWLDYYLSYDNIFFQKKDNLREYIFRKNIEEYFLWSLGVFLFIKHNNILYLRNNAPSL